MARPGGELAEAERPQLPAQRLLADRQAECVEHPLRQIDEAPAHHPVRRRDRTGLDGPRQRSPLLVAEERQLARCLAIDEPGGASRVEGKDSISHRPPPDAAERRRLAT